MDPVTWPQVAIVAIAAVFFLTITVIIFHGDDIVRMLNDRK